MRFLSARRILLRVDYVELPKYCLLDRGEIATFQMGISVAGWMNPYIDCCHLFGANICSDTCIHIVL